jgi:hypothetical protein
MSKTAAVMAGKESRIADYRSIPSDRLFYVIAGSVMLILTAVGFRNFYLHARAPWGEMTSQIVPLIVIHGLAMSGWIVLFFVQSALVLIGNRRLHVVIGPVGGVLAAAIVILGTTVAPLSVHFNPEIYKPFGGPRFFLAIMFTQMLMFGALVGVGFAYRRRPEIHRPMMLLATTVILGASLGRVPYTDSLATFSPLYVYGPMLLFGGLLFLVQWGMTRRANRFYLIGYAGIALACFLSVALGRTTIWSQMVGTFVP